MRGQGGDNLGRENSVYKASQAEWGEHHRGKERKEGLAGELPVGQRGHEIRLEREAGARSSTILLRILVFVPRAMGSL